MDSIVSQSWLNGSYAHAVRKGFTEPVTALKLEKAGPENCVLAVGFSTGKVSFYRIPCHLEGDLPLHFDDLFLLTIKAHSSAVTAIYFDEKILISGDDIGNLRVFDLSTKFCLTSVSGHETAITDIAFCRHSNLLASASSSDGNIIFSSINGASSLILKQLRVNSCSDILLAFDRSGEYLISSHGDSSLVCVWDARKKQKICETTCDSHVIDFMTVEYDRAVAPNTYMCTLVVACADGYIAEWTFDGLSLRMEADLQYRHFKMDRPSYLLVHRPAQSCIVGCNDGSVKIYDCDLYSDEMSRFDRPRYQLTPSHTQGPVDLITANDQLLITLGADNRINCFSFPRNLKAAKEEVPSEVVVENNGPQGKVPEPQQIPIEVPALQISTQNNFSPLKDLSTQPEQPATAQQTEMAADPDAEPEESRKTHKSPKKDKDKVLRKEKTRHREKKPKRRADQDTRLASDADHMSDDEMQSKVVSAICLALIAIGLLIYAVGPVLVV